MIQIGHLAVNGVAAWKHAILHVLSRRMEATLLEVIDWAEEMDRVLATGDERGEFPSPSALSTFLTGYRYASGERYSDSRRT